VALIVSNGPFALSRVELQLFNKQVRVFSERSLDKLEVVLHKLLTQLIRTIVVDSNSFLITPSRVRRTVFPRDGKVDSTSVFISDLRGLPTRSGRYSFEDK